MTDRSSQPSLSGLRVLYVGAIAGKSGDRMAALRRLGCSVEVFDLWAALPQRRLFSKLLHETGSDAFDRLSSAALALRVRGGRYDLAWVNCGELLGPRALRVLQVRCRRVVNYNNDNPFADRDRKTWRLYLKALPFYTLVALPREANVTQARVAGANAVVRVFLSADEIEHAPVHLSADMREHYASEVAFIGTWMPERGPLLAELIRYGVPLSIWGNLWREAPEWGVLRNHWRGRATQGRMEYAAAVQGSKVCLGLLSKGNRDLHTSRSVEIPALGGLLCAERTSEHLLMYREGEEAVFWADAAECAHHCLALLRDDDRRRAIARSGHLRCLDNGHFNEPVLRHVLNAALEVE